MAKQIDRFPIQRVVLADPATGDVESGFVPASEDVLGAIAANGENVGAAYNASHMQSVSVQVTGTFTGSLQFQVSNDGTVWVAKNLVAAAGTVVGTVTAPVLASGDIGAKFFRVAATAWTTGTASVRIQFSAASQANNLAAQAVTQSGTWSTTANPPAGSGFVRVTDASTNRVLIVGAAGNLDELSISNPTATPAFVKLYDKVTAPVVGDTALIRAIIPAPANSFQQIPFPNVGKRFAAGIGLAVTANALATDDTATVAGIIISGTRH